MISRWIGCDISFLRVAEDHRDQIGQRVPGWSTFAIANVLAFLLTSKSAGRGMAARAGFEIPDEGVCNGAWFVLLGKAGKT